MKVNCSGLCKKNRLSKVMMGGIGSMLLTGARRMSVLNLMDVTNGLDIPRSASIIVEPPELEGVIDCPECREIKAK